MGYTINLWIVKNKKKCGLSFFLFTLNYFNLHYWTKRTVEAVLQMLLKSGYQKITKYFFYRKMCTYRFLLPPIKNTSTMKFKVNLCLFMHKMWCKVNVIKSSKVVVDNLSDKIWAEIAPSWTIMFCCNPLTV